jgi:RHS repeat-associated protein
VNGTWRDSLVYDAAGNLDSLVSKKGAATNRWGYDWDVLNRLVTVRRNGTLIARYSYDVLGRRIVKRDYTVGVLLGYRRFVYQGDHVAFDADSANFIMRRYVWGMGTDELIAVRDSFPNSAATHYYTVKDKLGSIRGVVRRDGTWQYSKRFGPYGAEVEASGTDVGLRYLWTGREYDAETGFYYFRARYYEPAARRFISEDPIGYGGGVNLYAYVEGRVVEARDPSGLTPFIDHVNIMNEPGYKPQDWGLFFKTARQEFDEWVIKSMREASKFEFESRIYQITITIGNQSQTITIEGGRPDTDECPVCKDIPDGGAAYIGVVVDAFGIGGGSLARGFFFDSQGWGSYTRAGAGVGVDGSVAVEVGFAGGGFAGWSVGGQIGGSIMAGSVAGNVDGFSQSVSFGPSVFPVSANAQATYTWTSYRGAWR